MPIGDCTFAPQSRAFPLHARASRLQIHPCVVVAEKEPPRCLADVRGSAVELHRDTAALALSFNTFIRTYTHI
jgi:hypothetical protein